jgi:hypothetical protein
VSWWGALKSPGKILYVALWITILILFLWGFGVF